MWKRGEAKNIIAFTRGGVWSYVVLVVLEEPSELQPAIEIKAVGRSFDLSGSSWSYLFNTLSECKELLLIVATSRGLVQNDWDSSNETAKR